MGTSFSGYEDLGTYTDRLRHSSETCPNREVLIFYRGHERVAYTTLDLYTMGGRFASRLRELGLQKQDVVVNMLPNSPERVVTDIGIMMAGGVSANGNVLLADGADFFLNAQRARYKAIVMGCNDHFADWKVLKVFLGEEVHDGFSCEFNSDKAPDLKHAILISREDNRQVRPLLKTLRSSTSTAILHEQVDSGDLAFVTLTSGSTGYSKLVPRTHRQLIEVYEDFVAVIGQSFPLEHHQGQPFYCDRPLGWFLGAPFQLFCHAAPRVLTDLFPPARQEMCGELMWSMMNSENCFGALILSLDASSILTYLDSVGIGDAENFRLKFLLTTGQPYKKVQVEKLYRISDNTLLGYGSTEMSFCTFGCFGKSSSHQLKDYLCAKALPNTSIRVVNGEGEACKPDEVGTIEVKGKYVFKGYFNRQVEVDPQTVECFTPDGYLKTGDLGFFDKDDNIYVRGRQNDVIMYGHIVVYPCWLEERILRHPNVVEVCVIPVPDPIRYHEICACVKVREGQTVEESELKEHLSSLCLTDGGGSPTIKFFLIFDTDFPKTDTGKSDKQKLKQMAAEKFGVYE